MKICSQLRSLRTKKTIKKEPYLAYNQSYVNNNQPGVSDNNHQMGVNECVIRKQQATSYCYAPTVSPSYNQPPLQPQPSDNGTGLCAYDTNFFDPNDIFQLNQPIVKAEAAGLSQSPQTVLDMESGAIQANFATVSQQQMAYKYDSCDDAASLSSGSIFDDGYYSVQTTWEGQQEYFEQPVADFGFTYYNQNFPETEYVYQNPQHHQYQAQAEVFYEYM